MGETASSASENASLPGGEVLSASFFQRPADEVANELIGKVLWRVGYGGGRLTEVEAYMAEDDPASHAARGRTKRNAPMFGPPGTLYVFLSYGVHCLLNLVCEEEGVGSAVLVRSYRPLDDVKAGVERGGARGPGVVGRRLGIGLDMSGMPLGEESGVFVVDDGVRSRVGRSVRVGISRGAELPLRHYMVGSEHVSGPSRMMGGRSR